MITVALIANGEIKSFSFIAERVKTFQRIVAIDRGLAHCQMMGLQPDLLIGDFDSCPPDLLAHYVNIPRKQLPRDKDLTDLEAALHHEINNNASSLTIFGGWGGRIDHSLTHALILTRYPGKVRLETENEVLFSLEHHSRLHCSVGQTLSLIPLSGPVSGITTHGLKWELKDRTLDAYFVSISNICLQEDIQIQFQTGSLLCCLHRV